MEKGLRNDFGANNCFLNAVVQALYHIAPFRAGIIQHQSHQCKNNHGQARCVYCALNTLFVAIQYSDEAAIPPDVLRKTLATLYEPSGRFQLRAMDDAGECFESILRCLHVDLGRVQKDDDACNPTCLAHATFGFSMLEQTVCPCHASSEPLLFQQYVHYISASSLAEKYAAGQDMTQVWLDSLTAGNYSCPSDCPKKLKAINTKTILNFPKVLTVGMNWERPNMTNAEIERTLMAIEPEINIAELGSRTEGNSMQYSVSQIVCYYGLHYVAFFYSQYFKRWLLIDDSRVILCVQKWAGLMKELAKARYQPLLLFYEASQHEGAKRNRTPSTFDTIMQSVAGISVPSTTYHHPQTHQILKGGSGGHVNYRIRDETPPPPYQSLNFDDDLFSRIPETHFHEPQATSPKIVFPVLSSESETPLRPHRAASPSPQIVYPTLALVAEDEPLAEVEEEEMGERIIPVSPQPQLLSAFLMRRSSEMYHF